MRGVLVTAVVCLALGVGALFAFCQATTGLSLAYPFSAVSVHIDMTTTGIPAVVGLSLTALGAFLLLVATIIALVGLRRVSVNNAPVKRRETTFEE